MATMIDRMREVYATAGIPVEHASTENLNFPDLNDVDVGQCLRGQSTAEQNQLFGNRNNAQHDDPVIRVAAASAAQNLDAPVASEVLVELVADDDPGVRKVARAAVPSQPTAALARRLEAAPEPAREARPTPPAPAEAMGPQQPMPGER